MIQIFLFDDGLVCLAWTIVIKPISLDEKIETYRRKCLFYKNLWDRLSEHHASIKDIVDKIKKEVEGEIKIHWEKLGLEKILAKSK